MKTNTFILLAICWLPGSPEGGSALSSPPDAEMVRRATGIDTGVAIVIADDRSLACDLANDGRLLVHLLCPKAENVSPLRTAVAERGLGGRVMVDALPGDGHLPHPDRFVNLLAADRGALGDRAPSVDELVRVLVTRGIAYFNEGKWKTLARPRDDRLDGWTHRFYDASGNCVGRDRVAGFPRAVQWQHGPAMEDGCGNGKIPRIARGRHLAVDSLSGDLVCRDAGNGTLLWRAAVGQADNADFAVVEGRVYLYFDAEANEETRRRHRGGYGPLAALDLLTGRELWRREFQPKELYTQGSQRAVLRGGEAIVLDGLGAFRYDARTGRPIDEGERLTRGVDAPQNGNLDPAWPIFLGDPQRRSCTTASLPARLKEIWRVQAAAVRSDDLDFDRRFSERYLGPLSAPVAGGGLVVVAAPETHQVLAFDAASGKPRWTFIAGGKVDSPPTLAAGLAVFGCDDGSVYALRLADGRLAWRFRAAPTDGLAMHHGHLASAFPLSGSVLVLGDAVVAVAGHHTDLSGLHCWVLDLATGSAGAHRVIGADQPAVVANAVTVADADGRGFWLGDGIGGSILHLSLSLEDLPKESEDPGPAITFDRNGTRIRFRTDTARGGSTHGWKQAMQSGWARAHRLVRDDATAYALIDPTENDRHPVRADQVALLTAGTGSWRDKQVLWTASIAALDSKPSYGALIKAADRLCLGGGARDGSSGFLQVVEADTGELVATYDLPGRVTECGLAAAGGRLYVCCEDGNPVCFGAE